MGKESSLESMRRVANSMKVIRQSLNEQETENKQIRVSLVSVWGDREKTTPLLRELSVGRKKVRAYQTILHELKFSMKSYNYNYDVYCAIDRELAIQEACPVVSLISDIPS